MKASSRGAVPVPGVRRFHVDRREAGLRLDRFLVTALAGTSRKQAKRLVDGRRVAVNGRIEAMASRVLRGGETVEVCWDEQATPAASPDIRVLYRDEHCLAVDKPPGIPSGATRDPSRVHLEQLVRGLFDGVLTLVHRLDKDTSGVLLFAQTPEAARALAAAFRERDVEKVYLALVSGRPRSVFETVSHLREGEGGRMHRVRSGGARAETRFRVLEASPAYALLEARPHTGRTHQIRVQLQQEGHPIVGDSLYGGAASVAGKPVPRQMLHAWALAFPHPVSGEPVRIQARPPQDFRSVAEAALGKTLNLFKTGEGRRDAS